MPSDAGLAVVRQFFKSSPFVPYATFLYLVKLTFTVVASVILTFAVVLPSVPPSCSAALGVTVHVSTI